MYYVKMRGKGRIERFWWVCFIFSPVSVMDYMEAWLHCGGKCLLDLLSSAHMLRVADCDSYLAVSAWRPRLLLFATYRSYLYPISYPSNGMYMSCGNIHDTSSTVSLTFNVLDLYQTKLQALQARFVQIL